MDLAACARQRRLVRQVKDLEVAVAQRVGVSMLYTTPQLQMQAVYMEFLQRLADGAATRGPVRSLVPCLSLCVMLVRCV